MKVLIENTADTLQIDKKNWTKVKFGAVAIQQKISVDRDKTDLTFYVKGEHMGSQDLHLREWGELTDEYLGPAFIRYFEKDDILYGSRRTYLRKVVIAPFEGITSNTTLVIKANEKIIDKRLLPFVMMSEGFTDHSIKNSKGSVNPYINWKDLANYEFLLPPKAEQARLAELLWAMDEVIEKEKLVIDMTKKLKKSKLKETFKKENCRKLKIGSISESLDNKRIPIKSSIRTNGEYPYYGASGIVDYVSDFIFDEEILLISEDGENLVSRNLPIAYSVDEKCWVNNHAHVLKIIKGSRYLVKEYFNFSNISDFIASGTRPKLNKGVLMEMPIYLPFEGDDIKYERELLAIDASKSNCDEKLVSSQSLQKSLINQIF